MIVVCKCDRASSVVVVYVFSQLLCAVKIANINLEKRFRVSKRSSKSAGKIADNPWC